MQVQCSSSIMICYIAINTNIAWIIILSINYYIKKAEKCAKRDFLSDFDTLCSSFFIFPGTLKQFLTILLISCQEGF